jgi:hypothetical protein
VRVVAGIHRKKMTVEVRAFLQVHEEWMASSWPAHMFTHPPFIVSPCGPTVNKTLRLLVWREFQAA